jgi:hypothetical protein
MMVVFLSRVLDGILGGNIALAQAYITGKASCCFSARECVLFVSFTRQLACVVVLDHQT